MALYNQALFRQANILDLFYCSCNKLDRECKTLAKTLKKRCYFECPTRHAYNDLNLRVWVDALMFFLKAGQPLRYPKLNVSRQPSDSSCISQ